MQEHFKLFVLLFIFLSVFDILPKEKNIEIAIINKYYNNINNTEKMNMSIFISQFISSNIELDGYRNQFIVDDLRYDNIPSILNYIFNNEYDGFIYFRLSEDQKVLIIDQYDYNGIVLNTIEYEFDYENQVDNNFDEMIETISNMYSLFTKRKFSLQRKFINKKDFNLDRDYPFVNLSLNMVSYSMLYDHRINTVSIFPIEFRFSFFPLRYMEAGILFRVDNENTMYLHKNIVTNSTEYRYNYVDLFYGFFAGFSFFNEGIHYSLGVSFYNMQYILNEKFNNDGTYRSYFLPQFSIYQKFDIELFSFLNYSLLINFKTMPIFYKNDKTIYSSPFLYDYFVIELSLLGFSITF